MTEYPVQCFDNNGEPYGRYVNPHGENEPGKPYSKMWNIQYKRQSQITHRMKWKAFESFAEANAFPFPSGTIGKTYERDEVEVVKQRFYPDKNDWFDCNDHVFSSINKFSTYPYARQIFRLVPQPVEKEPETVDQAARVLALKLTNRLSYVSDFYYEQALEEKQNIFKDGVDWQKKQEASR